MANTAARVGSINVLLQVQFGQATAGLNNFAGTVETTGVRTQRAVSGIDRTVSGLNRTVGSINGRGFNVLAIGALRAKESLDQMRGLLLATSALFGGLVPAALGASLVRVADRAHLLSNNLKTVTKDADDLKTTQDALFAVSQRTRSGFESTATIYARTARATEGLNVSQAKLLRLTETIQKSFAIGGATTAEAQGAAIQLSQGIASNRFSGDEFRSVAENAPVLLRGMAQSLGVSIGKLREMAHAGELTATTVVGAIVDASQRIDEEFSKTTSTIGQAFVQVDNAILKYVGDSDKASVASNAIVAVLQALASNIDTVADALVILGGAFGAKLIGSGVNRLATATTNLRNMRIETLAAAKAAEELAIAEVKTARSDMVTKRLAFNRALSEGTLTAKQLERQQRAVAASVSTYNISVQRAAAATLQLKEAQTAASLSATAMAAAGRAVSVAWSFIGGPVGAALLAIGGVMYVLSSRAAEAQERSERYADAIQKAGDHSSGAAPGISEAARSLDLVSKAATEAERNVSLLTAQNDLAAFSQEMSATIQQLGTLANGWSTISMQQQIQELRKKFLDGEISIDDFIKKVDEFSATNPDASPIIAEIQRVAKNAAAAMGVIEALKSSAAGLGGGADAKGDRLVPTLSGGDFNSRFGQPYAKSWKELFPDFFKKQSSGRAPRKTADDRFDNDVQAIQDRIAAMREEQQTLGATFYEQQRRKVALDLEQQALKQVREEARKKGDQDWQNAQLSPDQIQQINDVSAAYAAQADELRKAQDAQDLQRDVLKGAFSDLRSALDDGKLDWKDLENIAINALDKIIDKVENDLVDAIMQANSAGSQGGGGGLFGLLSQGISWLFGGGSSSVVSGGSLLQDVFASAKGNAFSGPGIGAYSNQIVTRPTVFPFAKGIGLMGEKAGSPGEAIMPLTRMAGGDLGVSVSMGQDQADTIEAVSHVAGRLKDKPVNGAMHVTIGWSRTADGNLKPFIESVSQGTAAQTVAVYDRQMPDRMKQIQADPRLR